MNSAAGTAAFFDMFCQSAFLEEANFDDAFLFSVKMLDLLLESRIKGHRRIETPQLDVAYQVEERSFHVARDTVAPWGRCPVSPSESGTD